MEQLYIILLFVFVSCGNNGNERMKTFNGVELTIDEIPINDTFMINNSHESGIGVARVMPSSIGIRAQQKSATGVDTLPKIVRTSFGDGIGGSILFAIETDTLPITKRNGITHYSTQLDTVKVIMLVCDTSKIEGYSTEYRYSDSLVYKIKERISYTFWLFGYVVTGVETMPLGNVEVPVATKKEYLDENKNPFPKSIIIWMSKEIKQ